ncbi:hypothetical protein DL96DRAFT_1617129 [Flagelloscypha sp. PMI_526]|nr:hypothetical protein DL96DRAFT_1617129 [Flagelloscypha sp. PMI_526]
MPPTLPSEIPKETPTLRKGLACLACRKKKIRCDGKRPACGTCAKSTRSGAKCEYSDQASTARTQQLEDEVLLLQTRIEELEKMADPFFLDGGKEREWGTVEWSGLEKSMPPPSVLAQLVHNFFQHCYEFGFFLDHARLDLITFCPVCRNSVFLWAVHLAGPDSPWFKTAPIFLSRALAFLTTGIVSDCGDHELICQLQGQVLLATYYCQTGRFLDARSQLSSACSLIHGVGLHRIGAPPDPAPFGYVGPGVGTYILRHTPGLEPIETSERHRCFWTVMTLNNIWSGMDDVPSFFDFEMIGSQVTTPWPDVPEGSYTMGEEVVRKFFAQQPDNADSLNALIAKSSLLFSKASCVSRKYRPGMNSAESSALFAEFVALDNLIDHFAMTLNFDENAPINRVILARSLTAAATIKLHRRYATVTTVSRQKCMVASKTIASFTTIHPNAALGQGQQLKDRALWKIWVMAVEVLLAELQTLIRENMDLKTCITGMIDSLLSMIKGSIYGCPRARARYEDLRDLYAVALNNV